MVVCDMYFNNYYEEIRTDGGEHHVNIGLLPITSKQFILQEQFNDNFSKN